MGDILIVDGYNIIYYNDALLAIHEKNLDDARVKLMETLSSYASYKGWLLIVVFDAHKVKESAGVSERYDRFTHIVFTGKNETADSAIEKMVHEMKDDYIIRVATSDKDQQFYVLSQGAIRISARELWADIAITQQAMQKSHFITAHHNNNDFLQNRVNISIRERMEKMRRGIHKD